jgi:hypothetical protein
LKTAYVDSSTLVAVALGEPASARVAASLRGFDEVFSSTLLEAELRAALAREGLTADVEALVSSISWVLPTRRLTAEIDRVLSVGYAKGADLWHLANALLLTPRPADIVFVTLDVGQRKIAAALGFVT